MVVYADVVFLLNLCIDFLLLWLMTAIRRQHPSLLRILCAAILGAGYAVFQLWQPLTFSYTFYGKLLFSMLMVWVAIGYHSLVAYLRSLGIFYLISFVTGGGMFALHYFLGSGVHAGGGSLFSLSSGWGSPISWVFVLVAFPIVWLYTRFSFRSLADRQVVNDHLAKVRVQWGDVKLELMGLIDTGNQLRDPISRTPVILVEVEEWGRVLPVGLVDAVRKGNWDGLGKEMPGEWMTRVRLVPFRGAASDGDILVALKPDKLEVYQQGEWHEAGKVLVGLDTGRLSSDGTYQAILHPSCVSVAG
ncbi:stage II sporulation protein GA (sporulation sigma-E factor processing peptidase) [Marininema mesophilum]|uniref:Sporulation sigma-E factor-processing peptidase n=1 Tax=Marininema mesophilum TaxID=1048340 RepID=A0A1H2QDC1_9BACL|nr:sigma-E processing peptidase SpoIIGA [Marininema mesophilum]SDW05171.1 stage II sporulation protein GA (sporulation sigma-E factor processing peptidase) [Marininema mesophilum]